MHKVMMYVVLLLASTSALATGYAIKDQGIKAMGMANAFSAVADDATAAWYNPAALAFQQGVGIAIGGEVIFPKVNYTKAGKT
ncbi:MAG: outer membrane protein transport protein, partial [Mariprofundaceae bacterium]